MRRLGWNCGLALMVLVITCAAARAEDFCSEPVKTGQGLFKGFKDAEFGACVYRGMPFAKAPVGALRLKRPEPPAPHPGVFEATKFGPACLQEEDFLNGGKAESYGEDCLYLNVFRPAATGKFPVMVWIYGGGFVGGSGSFDIYDGSNLAGREGLVVVTINYRLAALGFMALPELKSEDPKGATGNYGIQDQARALEWVRDNISAFGGDPEDVTVFGQSAGGMSVCALLVSPEARGLFQRAMVMSGPCRLMTSLEDGYKKSQKLASDIGCQGADLLGCLRSKPMGSFLKKTGNDLFSGGVAWSPTIDGAFLPDTPVKMIQAGNYQQVPVIFGTTRDELRIYTMTLSGLGLWSRGAVNSLIKLLTGPNSGQILSMYDYQDYRRPIDVAFAFGNQMVFETPAFMMASAMSGKNPVYLYRFDWDQTRFPHKMGAFHAIDVPFVFGAMHPDAEIAKLLASKKTYQKSEYLSFIMMDYLGNFARSGNPNGKGIPSWPAFTNRDPQRLYFNTEISSRPFTEKEIQRYHWFAERSMQEVFIGKPSNSIAEKK